MYAITELFPLALYVYPDGSTEDNVSFYGNGNVSSKRNRAGDLFALKCLNLLDRLIERTSSTPEEAGNRTA
ncbi:MAG: hypothetical protein K2X93_16250 [Candidatus Obscuribacterales bacterium]|nr:hypothetical protein [Candidatus Obscuribacterales bacterium]